MSSASPTTKRSTIARILLRVSLLCSALLIGTPPLAQAATPLSSDRATGDLLSAISTRNYPAILDLVENPGILSVTNDVGDTPLHLAVAKQDALLVSLLLAYGANPEALNNAGQIPTQMMSSEFLDSWTRREKRLHYSEGAHIRRRHITNAFVTHFDQSNATGVQRRAQVRFFLAVKHSDMQLARDAISLGADPNGTQGYGGQTVMHLNEQPKLVQELKSMGVEVDAEDHRGVTPLSTAIRHSRERVVNALLAAGAQITTTPTHSDLASVARSRKSTSIGIAKRLLAEGAPASQAAWLSAISGKNHQTVQTLFRHSDGFDANSKEWISRIDTAYKLGGDRVIAVFERKPEIAAFVKQRAKQNEAKIKKGLVSAGQFVGAHVATLSILTLVFALLSALTALIFCKYKTLYVLLVCLGTMAMTHLFVFTDSIQLSLSNIRLLGEKTPGFTYFLYALFDGGALVAGIIVAGIAWLVMKKHSRNWLLQAPVALAFICVFSVLIAHNGGKIDWLTAGYQQLTGYDDHLQREEQERQERREKFRIASNIAEKQRVAEKNERKPHDLLFNAIKENSEPLVEAALATGVSVDIRDPQGRTALHYALQTYHLAVVPMLLHAGADVHTVDAKNRGSIYSLLYSNRYSELTLTLLERLIAAGADVNKVTDDGGSSLCLVAGDHPSDNSKKSTMHAVRKALIAHGARFRISDRCAFSMYPEQPQILSLIFAPDEELNGRQTFTKLNDFIATYQASPLWQAAFTGNLDQARLLLDLGAEVESRDTMRGMTVLQKAAHHASIHSSRRSEKYRSVVELLLAHGANTNSIAWDGTTFAQLDTSQLLTQLSEPANRAVANSGE